MKTDPEEVAHVNSSRRLHPSPWGKILNFWFAVVLLALGIWVLTIIPGYSQGWGFILAAPVIVIMALLIWFCVFRLHVLRPGTLTWFTGYAHDIDRHRPLPDQYPVLLYTVMSQGNHAHYYVRFNGKRFAIFGDMHAKFRPEQENTIYLAPNGRTIVNVVPA
ncbi:hypothetical protein [Amycolatopsis sp. FDAARGOS 1241]|uniref:hypothetical protein n=1 Tax=Amycolatopsis sp. FDAARGOS 1241 TaxID=2778070 RepID=UPI001951599A|nr:hypothetical protein [Amycolatopsis sp. FDAARGOS 1241]QRP48389.1 hypothetical protein I6J71_11325 [Amycolatopsis sp. FDAARGOS 1241]